MTEAKMHRTRREVIATLTAASLLPPTLQSAVAQTASPLTSDEARAIAKEAFFWGMHPVAIYHLRYNTAQNEQSPKYVGINRLTWDRKPLPASDRFATTPNATTLYGQAMLDLAKEPVVIIIPEIRDHYWSIQFADNYARWWPLMVGSQFNAPGPLRRLLVGPNWKGKVPPEFVGADIMQSPSDFAAVTARVALTDDTPEELKLVNGIQDGVTLMSLSQWTAAGKKVVKTEDVPITKGNYPTYPGMEDVKEPGKLQVEFSELFEVRQFLQSRIRHLRGIEVERGELFEWCDCLESLIRHPCGNDTERGELFEVRQFF